MGTTTDLRRLPLAILAAVLCAPAAAAITSSNLNVLTPNTGPGPGAVEMGGLRFTNLGLQGVGRLPAQSLDAFGETLGSVSALQLGNFVRTGASAYAGTFYTLPDRGFNNPPAIFSNYAGRIQSFDFTFTPATGPGPLAGNQITLSYTGGTKFTYSDNGAPRLTTGLDPGTGTSSTILNRTVPFVGAANGQPVNRIALDAEGLVMKKDGSGYVSDEYGPYIYKFDAAKVITGVVGIPEAIVPRTAGNVDFNSVSPPSTGRRNNQGMEGIALSPDGTRLFALVQSATVQDTGSGNQGRFNTRLLVYDVSGNATPDAPIAQYALQLPRVDENGNGSGVDRTAAQSEIVALGNDQILVLSRDSAGRGVPLVQPVFKSVLLVSTQGATNLMDNPAFPDVNNANGQISPGGTLKPGIVPVSWKEALNMLNKAELQKFGINLGVDGAGNPLNDPFTLSEKWERHGTRVRVRR